MNGLRFIEPPAFIYRRRPLIGPGLLALVGAVLAVLFLLLLLVVMEHGSATLCRVGQLPIDEAKSLSSQTRTAVL